MEQPVVIIGIGQLGGVFAKGFLSTGHPVYPVIRGMDMDQVADEFPSPILVLVAVPENALEGVLKKIPSKWKDKLGLLQNELLPQTWENAGITKPTVMAVWFEKKKDMEAHVFQPTPVYGPHADIVSAALTSLDIPSKVLSEDRELLTALVSKNLYVFTINIAGLKVGGTVGDLWAHHPELVEKVAHDVLKVQEVLTGEGFNQEEMVTSMIRVFGLATGHKCAGRVARDRLDRILRIADERGIRVDALKEIG